MQFLVFRSLVFNVFPDRIFIPMLTNGACKITICPEFPSPQFLSYFGTALEYFSRGEAFYHRYDLGHTICRNGLHQKMNMILICTNLQKFHLISLLYIQTYFLQNLIHVDVKDHTPILGWKHQMVY